MYLVVQSVDASSSGRTDVLERVAFELVLIRRGVNEAYEPTSTADTPPTPPAMKDLIESAVEVPCLTASSAAGESP